MQYLRLQLKSLFQYYPLKRALALVAFGMFIGIVTAPDNAFAFDWKGFLGSFLGGTEKGNATDPVSQGIYAVNEATCWLLFFIQGPFGGLLISATGVGAVVGCALGAYRKALDCLFVGVGIWMISPAIMLFFGAEAIPNCYTYLKLPSK
jgi:hypothetical protein